MSEKKYFLLNSNFVDCNEVDDFNKYIKDIAGNIGNSYITHSVINILFGKYKKLDGIKNLWFYQPNQYDIDKINNEYSKVILILQDNLRSFDSYYQHNLYSTLIDFFKKIKIPIVVFSLGCNSFDNDYKNIHLNINKDLIKVLKIISDNTVSFGVRGEFSKEVLHNIGIKNVDVTGCPSYFVKGKNRVIQKNLKNNSLKVLSGGYFRSNNHDLNYVLQDECLFIKNIHFPKERILESDLVNFNHENDFHKLLFEGFLNDRLHFFNNPKQWESFAKNFDFYIGSRVHGSIVAMNSGLPAVVTNEDTRAKEMSDLFGINCHAVRPDTNLLELYNSIDIDKINKKYLILFDNFNKWLEKNDLEFVDKDKNNNDKSSVELNLDSFKAENKTILVKILYEKLNMQKEKQINNLQSEVNNLSFINNNLQSEVNNLSNKINIIANEVSIIKKTSIKNLFLKYMIKFSSIFILRQKRRKIYRLHLKNKFQINL